MADTTDADEQADFAARCSALQASWASDQRWKDVRRPYKAEEVVSKQGTRPASRLDAPSLTREPPAGSLPTAAPASSLMAKKLWALLQKREKEGKPVHTMGAIDPVQVGGPRRARGRADRLTRHSQVTQMARAGLEALYISGWACSRCAIIVP